ncbi:hypothetical protein EYM_05680 [Ignicoccus islandicus DSM 13165]|uniref:SHSP domain-containing protein n=1 Tax=Ignicoccus islandicus DSM 13165 TaxID=940295 RepID=A0A0U2VF52_9CREN|nr:hypothetical protein [Ignicoccus islandicus]ALU12610.1 hypothetical protein EYM_05680 [Ignicoccus islandicus DSM 13165]
MISPNGKTEPLHYVVEYPDRYEVLIDVPLADERTLTVGVHKRVVKVRVKLRETIKLEEGEVREYVKILRIPEDAEEEYEVRVHRVEGPIIVIVFPKLGKP